MRIKLSRTLLIGILVAALLIAVVIVAAAGRFTFAAVSNTGSPTVAAGDAVPFNETGPASNITFTAPDTLTLGPEAGGTYTITYTLNLTNTAGALTVDQFDLEVDGALPGGTFAAVGVDPGAANTLTATFRGVALPSGAVIRLVSISGAELTNVIDGQTVKSATLKLERTGP